MLTNLKNHYYPTSIEEVIELLEKPNSLIIAGGTGLILERNDKVETLIDLQKTDLAYIDEKPNYIAIGAMTTAYEIANSQSLPESLRLAASNVGDTPLLHAVTIGGNLAKLYNYVDFPGIIWALDADIVIYNPEVKVLSSDEYFAYAKDTNVYSSRTLISEIRVPYNPNNSFSQYQSFVTTKNEKSQLILSSYFEWDDKYEIMNTRLVLSGTTNFPIRLNSIEEQIVGEDFRLIDVDRLTNTKFDDITFINSYKTSINYRKHILRVFLKRTLLNCQNKMEVQE